uniref:Truncated putative galactosyltransferase n=1 Tax=Campylobacter jejuni TaxID=197 RepID=Q1L2N0_CAMJU|nr:truncated putative galactosyltransferase [Campylobacter jejuni]
MKKIGELYQYTT